MIFKMMLFIASISINNQAYSAYTESDISFSQYMDFAKKKAGEAVSIQHPSGQSGYMTSCTGVLLNPWTVLTAGHCVTDENLKLLPNPNEYILGYGSNKNNPDFVFSGKLAIVHPQYAKLAGGGRINDIAVIILAKPFYDARDYVQFAKNLPEIGQSVIAYGYGVKGGDKGIVSPTNPSLNPDDPFLAAYESILSSQKFAGIPSIFEMTFDRKLDLGGNAAQGDSGGGVEDANGGLIGIISSIDQPNPGQPSTRTQATNITIPDMQNFISKNWVTNTFRKWTGTGKVSDLSNWEGGDMPQNGSIHYYVPITDGKQMIVDKDFSVDGVELDGGASFIVNQEVKANFEGGISISKGTARIDGGLYSGSLVVKDGGKYTSPTQINLFNDGYVFLRNGVIESKSFSMEGGQISGNGRIIAPSFSHSNGIISPSIEAGAAGIIINGDYKQIGKDAFIYIRLFQDGQSDYLQVDQNVSQSLNFILDFPDKALKIGSKYAVLKAVSGKEAIPNFSINSLYKSTGSYGWENGVLVLTIQDFSLGVVVAEDTRQVYKSFQNLRASGGLIPSSIFDKIRSMSHPLFLKSLNSLTNSYIEKDLHKAINTTFLYEKHQTFRTAMFLEKDHTSLDLRHFSFHGVNSFSGDDVPVHTAENAPSSFYISGDVYETGSKYTTDGLTIGWDFASGNELTGIGFYFRNQLWQKSSNAEQYQFDITKVYRGNFLFMDYNFGVGFHSQSSSFQDEWGVWSAKADANTTSLQSRFGFHSLHDNYAYLGYVGLKGEHMSVQNMKSISQDLEIDTKDYSGVSLKGKIGFENKIRFHIESLVLEPWMQLGATFALYDNVQNPTHRLFGVEGTDFKSSRSVSDSGNIEISGGVRLGVAKNMLVLTNLSIIKQQDDVANKASLSVNFRF